MSKKKRKEKEENQIKIRLKPGLLFQRLRNTAIQTEDLKLFFQKSDLRRLTQREDKTEEM